MMMLGIIKGESSHSMKILQHLWISCFHLNDDHKITRRKCQLGLYADSSMHLEGLSLPYPKNHSTLIRLRGVGLMLERPTCEV
jgi:hypothetical protein